MPSTNEERNARRRIYDKARRERIAEERAERLVLLQENEELKKKLKECHIKIEYLSFLNPTVYSIFDFYDEDNADVYPEELKEWYETNADIRDIVEPDFLQEWKENLALTFLKPTKRKILPSKYISSSSEDEKSSFYPDKLLTWKNF